MSRISRHQKTPSQSALTKTRRLLLFVILSLSLFGLLMIFDASSFTAYQEYTDKFHFVKLQFLWFCLGLIGLSIAAWLPLKLLKKIAAPFLLINLILLIAVLIPGVGSKIMGARRWINLFGFSLQPSELLKLSFLIYAATFFSKNKKRFPFLFALGLILLLLLLQPDLGTAIIITGIGFCLYFLSPAPIIESFSLLFLGTLVGLGLSLASPYRRQRLLTFLYPSQDPLGASYHIRQSLLALGSGGLFGTGIGQSRQKYQFLPAATTDSIFAVVAEETGFIGALVFVSLFLLLIILGFQIIAQTQDKFSQLLAAGIVCWLGLQSFLNIAAMIALVPLTGIPLPFISYGGSSAVVNLVAVGLLLNIARHNQA